VLRVEKPKDESFNKASILILLTTHLANISSLLMNSGACKVEIFKIIGSSSLAGAALYPISKFGINQQAMELGLGLFSINTAS